MLRAETGVLSISPFFGTAEDWHRCAVHTECTLHQLSPYIGKLKSSIASSLIDTYTKSGDTIYDPFCGSGTVALEAWLHGRCTIANDLSPYGLLVTSAKLFPPRSESVALRSLDAMEQKVNRKLNQIDLRAIDREVRRFFHTETLREAIAWTGVLVEHHQWFLLANLLGILHHQRPGFLSFPSSHSVPYLRSRSFPRNRFPELYEYRPVRPRLQKKIQRAFRRIPELDRSLYRGCFSVNASELRPPRDVSAIITSPPYMRQLDYGRDNRLRLWFLGVDDWRSLDEQVSPPEKTFLELMRSCLHTWHALLPNGAPCILVLGSGHSRVHNMSLADAIRTIAVNDVGGFQCEGSYLDTIPTTRRVRRSYRGVLGETILVLRKTGRKSKSKET